MKLRKAGVPFVKPVATVQKSSLDRVKVSTASLFFRAGRLQEDPGSKSTSGQCSQGLDPDVAPRFCCHQHGNLGSVTGQCDQ